MEFDPCFNRAGKTMNDFHDPCETRSRPIKGTSRCEIFGSLFGGGGDDERTTTQTTEPPAWLAPHLQFALGEARGLYDRSPYPRATVRPGLRDAYLDAYRAGADPQLIDPALGLAQSTIGGDYLSADALRGAARAELDDVIGNTRQRYTMAGGTGGSGEGYSLGRGITSALAPVYQRERAMQQQMGLQAPAMEAFRYQPYQQQISALQGLDAQENFYHNAPWESLNRFTGTLSGVGPMAGGTTTNTQPIYNPSPFQQLAGLGMTAAGMYFGGPAGASMGNQIGQAFGSGGGGGMWGASPNSSWGGWGV